MVKTTRSIRLSDEVWKAARKYCIDNDIKVSDYIEELIKKDLGVE